MTCGEEPATTQRNHGDCKLPSLQLSPGRMRFSAPHNHPADNRSAIPTRAYESGSGHGHDAAPAGHPHPPRAPPDPATPGTPCPSPPVVPASGPPGVKGAFGVAPRALRAPGPRGPARVIWQRSRPWASPARPRTRRASPGKRQITAQTRHSSSKSLTGPLHMSTQIRPDIREKPQLSEPCAAQAADLVASQEALRD
jgi:hypothetical protein